MACEKAGIRAGYIRRKTLNTYIYKTKKYIIAQILWDLAGVICLAFSPLLQQWLFDYGLQSPLKKIVMVVLAYGALLVFYTLSQYFFNSCSASASFCFKFPIYWSKSCNCCNRLCFFSNSDNISAIVLPYFDFK